MKLLSISSCFISCLSTRLRSLGRHLSHRWITSKSFTRSSHHGNNVSCSNVLVRWQSKQVSNGSPAFGADRLALTDLFIPHTPFLLQNTRMVFLFTFIQPPNGGCHRP